MYKSQAEKKFYAFHAVFRVDVNDDKQFQKPQKRRHLIISLIRNLCLDFYKTINLCLIQTLLLLILFQQFTTGVRLVTRIPK